MHSSVWTGPSGREPRSGSPACARAEPRLSRGAPAEPAEAATCPCTIFTSTQTPTVPADPDTDPIELGVKFRADQDGFVTGIRFYKGTGNTGTHTGSLWSSAGTRLATVTFTGETATGWQQATFASPVAVTANTTYVASYYAPNGRYAADDGYFAGSGVTNSPLTALQNGVDGGNGVYRYGTGGGFPNSTFSSTNYWVDLVFNPSGPDTTKPTVTDRQPAAGATGVPSRTTVSATFSEAVQESTIAMTLTAGSALPASTSYDSATRTVTLTPNANLAPSTTYTVNLSGARDSAGNQMDPVTWTFTTAAAASGCPCTIWPNTTCRRPRRGRQLGGRARRQVPDQPGRLHHRHPVLQGHRQHRHARRLAVDAQGNKLASVTFTGETATGWQQATFGAPVSVTANTTYVASYYAPVGRYAVNRLLRLRRNDPRSADRAAQRHRRWERGLQVRCKRLPEQHLPVQQLLGGRGLRHRRTTPLPRRSWHECRRPARAEWPSAPRSAPPSPSRWLAARSAWSCVDRTTRWSRRAPRTTLEPRPRPSPRTLRWPTPRPTRRR